MAMTGLKDLTLIDGGKNEDGTFRDFSGDEVSGVVHSAVFMTQHVQMAVAYKQASNGISSLSGENLITGPLQLQGIVKSKQIGVYDRGDEPRTVADMMLCYFPPGQTGPRTKKVGTTELDRACGGDVAAFLLGKGVLAVGTRADVYGETNNMKTRLCARVPDMGAAHPLLWVWAVTRLLPLIRQIEGGI